MSDKVFKVYYTDPIPGRDPPTSMPPAVIPLTYPSENAALDVAFEALRLNRIVWKVEYPDGTIVDREQIEFVYRNLPPGAH